MDFTTIVSAVALTTVVAGVLAMGAAKMAPIVATKGVQWVIGAFKRG